MKFEVTHTQKEADRRKAIDTALYQLRSILECQGWKEALRSDDPGNVTAWLGPRLHSAIDALEKLEGPPEEIAPEDPIPHPGSPVPPAVQRRRDRGA